MPAKLFFSLLTAEPSVLMRRASREEDLAASEEDLVVAEEVDLEEGAGEEVGVVIQVK